LMPPILEVTPPLPDPRLKMAKDVFPGTVTSVVS
jgi:hypothetical protein